MPQPLMSTMKLDAKKTMMNSKGFFIWYAEIRRVIPQKRKNDDSRPIRMSLAQRKNCIKVRAGFPGSSIYYPTDKGLGISAIMPKQAEKFNLFH